MTHHRADLVNPGRRKRVRWEVCLHEAAHAVAYSRLCGVSARPTVAWRTGLCRHGPLPPQGGPYAVALTLAAGNPAAARAMFCRVPGRRPRRSIGSQKPAKKPGLRDEDILAFCVCGNDELEALGFAGIQDAARRFVAEHLDEILIVARRLFVEGKAFVPARRAPAPVVQQPIT